jgi:hypothetical protein
MLVIGFERSNPLGALPIEMCQSPVVARRGGGHNIMRDCKGGFLDADQEIAIHRGNPTT